MIVFLFQFNDFHIGKTAFFFQLTHFKFKFSISLFKIIQYLLEVFGNYFVDFLKGLSYNDRDIYGILTNIFCQKYLTTKFSV